VKEWMPRRVMLAVLLIACAFAAAGCRRDVVHVKSNTFWDGTINGNIGISGFGDKDYEIHGKLGCVQVQKQLGDTLYLRLRLNDGPEEETRAAMGVIYQCK